MSNMIKLNGGGAAIASRRVQNDKKENKLKLELGAIVNATVTSRDKKTVTLTTKDNVKFTADSKSVVGEVGDELSFEVIKSGKDGIELRQKFMDEYNQTKQTRATGQLKKISVNYDMFKKNDFISEEKPGETELEDNTASRTSKAIAAIRRKLAYASESSSRSAVRELVASGLSLSKISISVLSAVSSEITHKEALSPPDKQKLQQFGAKLSELTEVSENQIVEILRSEKPLTVGSLYLSKYSSKEGASREQPALSDDELKALEPEINKFFDREQIEPSKRNTETAMFLLKNDVPLTKENMQKVELLSDLRDNLDIKRLMEQAAQAIINGDNAMDVELSRSNKDLAERYDEIIKILPKMSENSIEYLMARKSPINLKNLKQAAELGFNTISMRNAAERMRADIPQNNAAHTERTPAEHHNAAADKLRLMEIQLRLTHEAAHRLVGKNINIETMPLQEAVETLREMDAADYEKNLRIAGAEPTRENVSKMSVTFNRLAEIKLLTNNVFGKIIHNKADFTINGIYESVSVAKVREYMDNYESITTARNIGNLDKYEEMYADALEGMGLESTPENIRAASILAKNKIDITEEGLAGVKLIDAKITAIQSRLHPNIAASIIKDGINPVEMHVDEMLEYIDKYEDLYGESTVDKIAAHIRELDDNKTIDDDMHKALTATYRMLNIIQKDSNAVLGLAAKENFQLTLGNLMDTTKLYLSSKSGSNYIDFSAEEGGVVGRVQSQDSIRNILRDYITFKTGEFAREANPNALSKAFENFPDANNEELDRLTDYMRDENATDATEYRLEKSVEQVNDVINASQSTLQYMQDNQIPMTTGNIIAAQGLIKNPFFVGDGLNRVNEKINRAGRTDRVDRAERTDRADKHGSADKLRSVMDTDLTPLKEGKSPEEILNDVAAELNDIDEAYPNERLFEQITLIQNAIKVQNFTAGRGNGFSLPVGLHDGVSSLNMYVLNEQINEGEPADILMSIKTGVLGEVSAYFTIRGDSLSVKLKAAPDSIDALRRNEGKLLEFLREAGISADASNVEYEGV